MSQAGLIDIESSHPQIATSFTTDSGSAVPLANVLEILGSTVANATNAQPLFTTGSGNTVTAEIQVATEITGAPGDKNDAGICSFDDASFAVDADGYVTLSATGLGTITGDSGGALSPTAGNWNILGGTGVDTSGAASTLTINITGASSFTTGSVIFWGASAFDEDNSNLFWDDTNNRLGVGINTPLDSLHVVGNMELDHTAAENDDHALEIIVDANNFSDVKGLDIDYIAGDVAAGEDEEAILVNIDESASTGGIIAGYLVLSTAEGSAEINGYETGININPVVQEAGTFGNADDILNIAVDVTAALASGGAGGISIFVADDDTFTVGDAATWDEFEIILDTGASQAGVAPTYAYSTGGANYTTFSPADGTNGFRNTGAVLWDSSDLAGWATATSGRFEIRITRTRNNLNTTPIIDELQISSTTEFKWDKSGDVNINSLTLVVPLTVPNGGTGLATITDGGVMLGSGTGAVTPLGQATNGQLVIGSTGADPVLAALASADGTVTIANTAGAIDLSVSPATFATPGVYNIGFDYNGGTGVFSITSADGTALSSTNIGYVTIWSREASNPGALVTIEITSNVSFIDDVGSSEIINNLFGLTTGVAYAQNLPFWIHAVLNDAETAIAFMLSRNTGLTSPAAADIGAPDDAVAQEQNDYWSFDNIDETLFNGNPSMPIGVIYMRMTTSDDWTVQGLFASSSGVNFPSANWMGQNFSQNFPVAQAQFGAATGTHMIDNSGTAPTFTTDNMRFNIDSATARVWFYMNGNTATDGAGAVSAQIALPYTALVDGGSGSIIVGSGYVTCPAYTGIVVFEMAVTTTFCLMRDINGNLLQNQDFADGDRAIHGQVIYRTGANSA